MQGPHGILYLIRLNQTAATGDGGAYCQDIDTYLTQGIEHQSRDHRSFPEVGTENAYHGNIRMIRNTLRLDHGLNPFQHFQCRLKILLIDTKGYVSIALDAGGKGCSL
jgi:hypothetical protein